MARKTAGHRFPHATTQARQHDHAMCSVVGLIVQRAKDGDEPWGTPHHMPALGSETEAHSVRNRLFNARSCAKLAKVHGQLSVSVMYLTPDGDYVNARTPTDRGFVLVLRVWPRETGRKEIIGRVQQGQRLAYNAFREEA